MSGICPCTLGNSVSAALGNLKKAKRLNPEQPTQTAPATVLSRRVVRRNEMFENDPWAYLVRFRLDSGEELELQTAQEDFNKWEDGTEGTLIWRGDTFVSFTRE